MSPQRPCKEAARGYPPAHQRERPQKKPILLAPSSWTSSLQNCETNFCHLGHLAHSIFQYRKKMSFIYSVWFLLFQTVEVLLSLLRKVSTAFPICLPFSFFLNLPHLFKIVFDTFSFPLHSLTVLKPKTHGRKCHSKSPHHEIIMVFDQSVKFTCLVLVGYYSMLQKHAPLSTA
jgi:hypothetical protein